MIQLTNDQARALYALCQSTYSSNVLTSGSDRQHPTADTLMEHTDHGMIAGDVLQQALPHVVSFMASVEENELVATEFV